MPNQDNPEPTTTKAGTAKPERHNARDIKTRFNIRMPNQLLENLKAEHEVLRSKSTRTGHLSARFAYPYNKFPEASSVPSFRMLISVMQTTPDLSSSAIGVG